MSSACVCHTNEWCFYCEMYVPLEQDRNNLLGALGVAERQVKFWKEATETQKNNNLAILKERVIMMDLLREVSELLSWRDEENSRKEALKKIYTFVDSLSKENTP